MQMSQSPLTERGGTFPVAAPGPKNYMSYNSGGAYDDDAYSLYAPSNYGNEGKMEIQRNEQQDTQRGPVEFHRESRMTGQSDRPSKRGFEVMNQEAVTRSQEPTSNNQEITQGGNYYACPVCSDLAIKACGCQYRDAACSKGHIWFMNGGKRMMGISPGHGPQQPTSAPPREMIYTD